MTWWSNRKVNYYQFDTETKNSATSYRSYIFELWRSYDSNSVHCIYVSLYLMLCMVTYHITRPVFFKGTGNLHCPK